MSKIPNDVQKAFNDMLNNFDGLDVKYTDEDSTNHELYANITNADSYSDFKNKIESEFEKVDYSDMYDAVEYTKQTDFGQIIVEFLDDNRLGITVDWSYLADQIKDDSSEEVSECADLFESEASDDTEIAEVMTNLFANDKADIRTKIVGDDLDYDVTYAGETVHVTFDDVEGKFKYYINGFGPYESTEAKGIENTIVNFIVTRGQNNKIEESISSVTRQHGLLKAEAADMYRAGYALCLSEDCKSIFSKAADYAQFCEGKDVNGNDIKRDFKTHDVFKVRHIIEGTMYKRISNYDEFDNGNVIHSDWSKLSAEAAEDLAKQKSIEHPDQIFYVQYDDVMEPCSDLRWVNGKSYNWSDIKFIEGKPVIISVNEAAEESLQEASYGGAYDIADDEYFNKEELVEFGEDAVDCMNAVSYSKAKLDSIFIENNVIKITISWDGNEVTVEQPVDMRRIRTPKDIEKYRIPVISKMKSELNKLGFDFGPHPLQDESLNESSDYELARPNSVKLMSYINRGSINPEDALSSLIDYLSDGEVGEFLDYIVGEYDLDESLNDSFREEVEPGKYVIRSFAKAANPYVAEYSRKTGKHIGYLGDGGRSWVPADSKSIMTFDTYDEAAAYAEYKVKDFYNAEVFKVERPLELEENCSDGDFKNQLIDDLTKQFFSREEAVKLVDKDINWAENLAYGNATPEDFIEAEEWLANN